jgi:membrane protein insertase Oxa1/YidC/SpoIIIJ
MRLLFDTNFAILGSAGVSVIALSATFALLMMFIRRWAESYERRIRTKLQAANAEAAVAAGDLKGEACFLAIEKVYQRHNYHPIQTVGIGASFLVMLPVLLSALILFTSDGVVTGRAFLFVADLSQPDGLLGPVNLLPLIMSGVTVIDARLRFSDDIGAQHHFYFIAAALLVFVHNLASALVLYWTVSNACALFLTNFKKGEPEDLARS